MNINDYRRGMDRIIPGPELKERIMNHTSRKKYVPVRRAVNLLLAAALALACLCTALAASPELRTAVLSFLRLEEREQVPGGSGSQTGFDVSQMEIGELVKAQYIRLDDRRYGYSNGLFNDLTWSDDYRELLDAKFWEVRDSQLVPVELQLETTRVDITWNGQRYQGLLYWFVREGELTVFQGSPVAIDTQAKEQWYVDTIPGRTDAVMLRLYEGRQMEYTEYPVLYHLDTGAVEDILAGTGADALEYAYSYSWSEDFRRAIILCASGLDGQQTWVCDRERKALLPLEDLTGLAAQYASFADKDTLLLSAYGEAEDGSWQDVTCWVYHLPSGQTVKTLDHAPCYRRQDENPSGAMLFGSCCVLISQEGQVQIIDLKTGAQTILTGFTFQAGARFMPSPSGTKLLYYTSASDPDGLGISQIGVIDFEKNTFIAFDREGYQDLYEEGIGWQDDSTVSINAHTLDGETRYLLLYQF